MININEITAGAIGNLKKMPELSGISIISGARRPAGFPNPTITVFLLVNAIGDLDIIRSMLVVNVFADNLDKGMPDKAFLASRAEAIVNALHEKPLARSGVYTYNCRCEFISDALWDPDDPDEHYVNCRFSLITRRE